MSLKRRIFTKDFKLRAVELSYQKDRISDLARELEVRPELIYRWRSELLSSKEKSFPGKGKKALSKEDAEVLRLKKQLADKEMELEILKKAIGIFSKRDGKSIDL